MQRDLRRTARTWLAQRRPAVVVAVLEANGALARQAGSRMLVSEGQRVGSVGGGHLELEAICEAEELLGAPPGSARRAVYALDARRGSMTLTFAPLDDRQLAAWPEPRSLFHLQLHGGGALAAALARILATIDCTVDWIEAAEAVEAKVAEAPAGAYYLLLAQDRELELRLAEAILRRGDFGYLGLVGTKTKRVRYARRLEQNGIAPELLARIACPAGIGGIAARYPEALAVALAAQLLQRCNA